MKNSIRRFGPTGEPAVYDAHQERLNMRMRAIANVFTKTDRILTGDRAITVLALNSGTAQQHDVVFPSGVPGMSQYPNIMLNVSAFSEVGKTSTLVGLLGLNYHELSHIMFTPRGFKKALLAQKGPLWGYAFNLLEDQRIESFFTALYEPAGKFFTETFVRFAMNDEQYWDRVFMFSYGRGFLPLEIRQEFEARFVEPSLINEIKSIIDDFKQITSWNLRVNSLCCKTLRRMVSVLQQISPPPNSDCNGAGQESGTPNQEQEKEARKKDRTRQRKEDRTGEDQSNFWDEDDEDEEEDGEGAADGDGGDSDEDECDGDDEGGRDSEDGDDEEFSNDDGSDGERIPDDSDSEDDDVAGEGDSEGGSLGDSEDDDAEEDSTSGMPGDDDGEGEESDEDASASEDEPGSDQAGNSTAEVESEYDDDELKEYLDDISEAIEEDINVQDQVGRMQTAMNDNTNLDVIDFGLVPFVNESPDAQTLDVVSTISGEFRKLWADVEPGWKYGSNVGRINIERVMHDPDNFDEWFDEWDEGRETDLGLETVILLDCSSSMLGSDIRLASRLMWVLKKSLDEIDAKVTVLGFHTHTVGLFDRNKKAGDTIPQWTELHADTRPAHGMKLARTILTDTPMPNKLFVVITDGGFSGLDENNDTADYIELVDQIPGVKMYVGIGAGGGQANGDCQERFHVRTVANNPMDIAPLVEVSVRKMIQERLHNR